MIVAENVYAYATGNPVSRSDARGLVPGWDDPSSAPNMDWDVPPIGPVPRPEVRAWICQVLANSNVNYDVKRAASAAYGLRKANDDPILREGENWLTSAAFNGWLDPQAYVMNIYIWQWVKWLPISNEPYSQDALNAGLDGHRHADHNSKDDMKKWCSACGK